MYSEALNGRSPTIQCFFAFSLSVNNWVSMNIDDFNPH